MPYKRFLKHAFLNNDEKVIRKDLLTLIDLKHLSEPKRKIQEYIHKKFLNEIGYPPYEILEIFDRPDFKGTTFFTVIGEKKVRKDVNKIHFEKYN